MRILRRHWPASSLGALAIVVAGLVLLALPMRSVEGDAKTAQDELTRAVEALGAGETEQGFTHVANARSHVDDVTDATDGVGAKVLSRMPLAGSGVRDVRDLATAMDHLTTALEIAAGLHPQVSGEGTQLLTDGNVNLGLLNRSLTGLKSMHKHVRSARTRLHDVEGNSFLLGSDTAKARDSALARVDGAVVTLNNLSPLFETLPDMLGAKGERGYVVAMMNPTEMKYSGGSMLTFMRLTVKDGQIIQSEPVDGTRTPELFRLQQWERIANNPFAHHGLQSISHASSAPSWSISGEETLRVWDQLHGQENDGLIAVDLVAMSNLLEATGPLEVPGLGTVTADNLLPMIAADYASFGTDGREERQSLNQALIPAFMDRVFSGVDFLTTMRALGESANGRNLALYFRDDDAQKASAAMGFAGDLSDTEHDYIGAFTQNRVGSKADFWQQKKLKHTVRLNPDGSARVTLRTTIVNTAPAMQGELSAYTNPRLDLALTSFLPHGAEVRRAKVTTPTGEAPAHKASHDYFGRPFITNYLQVDAAEQGELKVTYDVPEAAVRKGDELIYRLDIDPHPTTKKEEVEVTVRWPDGFAPSRLQAMPPGWVSTEKGHSRWETPELEGVTSLELVGTSGP